MIKAEEKLRTKKQQAAETQQTAQGQGEAPHSAAQASRAMGQSAVPIPPKHQTKTQFPEPDAEAAESLGVREVTALQAQPEAEQAAGQGTEPPAQAGTQSGETTKRQGKKQSKRQAKKQARKNESPADKAARKKRQRREIRRFFFRLFSMGAILYILFGVLFGLAPMRSEDMKPRISPGDVMLYYRLEDRLRAADVVLYLKENKQYVGRIVALPGDTVNITESKQLQINNSTVTEPNIFYPTGQYEGGITLPYTVPENSYFVLADFREGGKDSRLFGAISRDEIAGKVMTVLRRSGL